MREWERIRESGRECTSTVYEGLTRDVDERVYTRVVIASAVRERGDVLKERKRKLEGGP
jgi:hypothetical protein